MARNYEMFVKVDACPPSMIPSALNAMETVWPGISNPNNWGIDDNGDLSASAEGYLLGTEGEAEFAFRMANAVWDALGQYRMVLVQATDLEIQPYGDYLMDREDYESYSEQKEEAEANNG